MSLKAKILKATEKTGGATLQDIYGGAQGHSKPSVRGLVYKMAGRGELEKTPEGNYVTPGKTPVTDSAADTGSEEESQEGEESETESTGPEFAPQEEESDEESPGEETPDGETESPKPSAEEALADALNKFANTAELAHSGGTLPTGGNGPKREGKKGGLPTFEAAREKLGKRTKDTYTDDDLGPSEVIIDESHIGGVLRRDAELDDRFRLPEELVEDGRKARNARVIVDSGNSYSLRYLFDTLKNVGIRNTKKLRRNLLFDARNNLYAFTKDSEIAIVIAYTYGSPKREKELVPSPR